MTVKDFAPVRYDVVRLSGGLDQVTPTLQLPSGVLTSAKNFEVSIFGGYSRIEGYERFDGRFSPSQAQYSVIPVTLTATVTVGQTVTTPTPGSGVVIAVLSGALVLTKITGSFVAGAALSVGGTPVGSVSSAAPPVISPEAAAIYMSLAANVYRPDILAVPGSGPIRGVIFINGTVYAFRDNVGATAGAIYKSSLTGWQLVPLGFQIGFNTGTTLVAEGAQINGATSGATGVVTRVALESGAYTGGTAAGRFILSSTTGTFTVGENLRVGATVVAKATTAATAITRAAGGRVETDIGSFTGSSKTPRTYGADGVNRAFEFDGTVYVPLNVGTTPVDAPSRVQVHQNSLFLAQQTSVFYSVLGNPYSYSALLFAGEISIGQNVTAMKVLPGAQGSGAMAIYTEGSTQILYGKSYLDFNLVSYNTGAGAAPFTAQNFATTYVYDQRGVTSLVTAQSFGNFDSAAVTLNLRPFVQENRGLVSGSALNREKSQYRIFFSNGKGLYCTFANGQDFSGAIPVEFPNPVTCICDGKTGSGNETKFFGSSNGFVYELGVGTSFDGAEIAAQMTLNYNPQGNSRVKKRYRKALVEVQGTGFAKFEFGYSLAYGTTAVDQMTARFYGLTFGITQNDQTKPSATDLPFSPSFWDSAIFEIFTWDGFGITPSEVEMTGTGENVAVQINAVSDYYSPFTINSLILHYSSRRGLR